MRPRPLIQTAILATGLFFVGQDFEFDEFSSVMLALSGVFLSLFATTFYRYWRCVGVGRRGERNVREMLSELGLQSLHDLYLPTRNGSVQIDHVVLFPGSLAVIETKTYNGRFEMHVSDHWCRLVGRRRYKIKNPLRQLEYAKKALSASMPGVRVWGAIVLAGNYVAMTGHPRDVWSLGGFRNYIIDQRNRYGEWRYSKEILEAWDRLNRLKNQYAPLGKTHVMNARKNRGERFYDFEEIWPLWLWGSLAVQAAVLCVLAEYNVI